MTVHLSDALGAISSLIATVEPGEQEKLVSPVGVSGFPLEFDLVATVHITYRDMRGEQGVVERFTFQGKWSGGVTASRRLMPTEEECIDSPAAINATRR